MNRLDMYRSTHGEQGKGHPAADDPGRCGPSVRGPESSPLQTGRGREEQLEALNEKLGGEIVREGRSSLLAVREDIPFTFRQGEVSLEGVRSIEPGLLPALFTGRTSTEVTPGDLLFFDVETTGLSGGAGTNVFLAGFLRITESGLLLTQYFMNDLSSERLYLGCIREQLGNGRVLVSYNGKGYDYNLIRSRYILNGFPPEDADPLHMDLLFSARRMWRGILPDFALGTVERMVLGRSREWDIPAWRIPEVYFAYLRGREIADDLRLVFLHNRDDILSLCALLVRQVSFLSTGVQGPGPLQEINLVSTSDMLLKRGYQAAACRFLELGLENDEAVKRLGLVRKRQRMYGEALELFGALAARTASLWDFLFACTEAAKLCEHALGDTRRALSYTEMMRERCARARVLSPELGERLGFVERSILRRARRLEGKLAGRTQRKGCGERNRRRTLLRREEDAV
jgi:uncharacterized protein YprB with RNaseH-like and TPR domain